jgi:phage-related tail fiber protein
VLNGRQFKDAVRCATTTNITLSGLLTLDGITVVVGDRVLVKDQTTASQNGIYVAASGAWTRSTDADNATPDSEVKTGMTVMVSEGTTQLNQQWSITTNGAITIGVTSLVFAQTGSSSTYTAGTGILIAGNVISADPAVVVRKAGATVGGASTAVVAHNLNTLDVTVEVYEIATGDSVDCGVTRNSVNQVTLSFDITPVPAAASLRAVVTG